jgi:putative transposase
MVYNQSGFGIKNNIVRFSHKYPSKITLEFDIPEKFSWLNKRKIRQISIYQKDDYYYISATYEQPVKKYKDNGKYQAFDLGIMKHTAINSDGKFIEFINPRIDKYWNKTEDKIQSKRDSFCKGKKKKSRKWKLYHKVLNRIKRKKSNQIRDYLHKLSRKIVDNTKANTIIVGDLSIKSMCNNNLSTERRKNGKAKLGKKQEKGLHRSQHNTGYISRFVSFLTYKSEIKGKRVIEKDEMNTSKRCSLCGKYKDDLKLGDREYICDCGNKIDRDKNSTINQMCLFLSQKCFVDKLPIFIGNLGKNQGIIVKKPMISNFKEAITST